MYSSIMKPVNMEHLRFSISASPNNTCRTGQKGELAIVGCGITSGEPQAVTASPLGKRCDTLTNCKKNSIFISAGCVGSSAKKGLAHSYTAIRYRHQHHPASVYLNLYETERNRRVFDHIIDDLREHEHEVIPSPTRPCSHFESVIGQVLGYSRSRVPIEHPHSGKVFAPRRRIVRQLQREQKRVGLLINRNAIRHHNFESCPEALESFDNGCHRRVELGVVRGVQIRGYSEITDTLLEFPRDAVSGENPAVPVLTRRSLEGQLRAIGSEPEGAVVDTHHRAATLRHMQRHRYARQSDGTAWCSQARAARLSSRGRGRRRCGGGRRRGSARGCRTGCRWRGPRSPRRRR